jgi:hypothetical protein
VSIISSICCCCCCCCSCCWCMNCEWGAPQVSTITSICCCCCCWCRNCGWGCSSSKYYQQHCVSNSLVQCLHLLLMQNLM